MKILSFDKAFFSGWHWLIQVLYRQQQRLPIVYALLAMGTCFMAYDHLGTWKATAWAVTYQDFGFVKRGLPGSLIPEFLYGYQGFWTISLGLQLALMFALYCMVWTIHIQSQQVFPIDKSRRQHPQEITFFLCLFSLLAPFSLQQFSKDFGRFDQICLLMAIVSMALFLFSKSRFKIFIIALMFTLMPLVHEASVLIVAPTYIAGMLVIAWQASAQQVSQKQAVLFAVLGLTLSFILVITIGKAISETKLFSIVQIIKLDFEVEKGTILVLNHTLEDNIGMTLAELPKRLPQIIGTIVFMIPIWKVLLCLQKQLRSVVCYAWLIPVSALSILPMFVLGIDFFRWIALAVFNVWFVQMLLTIYFNQVSPLLEALYHERRWLYLSVFASIWMGPVGITSYFPDPWVLIVGKG